MENFRLTRCSVLMALGLVLLPLSNFSQNHPDPRSALRTWTNNQGKAVQGILIAVEGEEVRLLVGEKDFVIPLSNLSTVDNDYVREWQSLVSVSRIREMRVLRSEGTFEILGKNGEVIDEGNVTGSDLPEDSPTIESGPEVDDPGKAKRLAIQHKQVFAGQSIRTVSGVSVDLYSTSGLVLQVQGESEVHIPDNEEEQPEGSLRLLKGSLFLNVDATSLRADRKEFRLTTPTALLAVKGTQFFARVKSDETISGVYEGKVEGRNVEGEPNFIEPLHVTEFLADETVTREMTGKEKDDRKIFEALSVTKSSLAERTWGWDYFDWEVHSLLKKEGPSAKREISNVNIKRVQNQAGNLATQFGPVGGEFNYGEFRIDTIVSDFGENFLGAEFRVRADSDVKLIITTIGADRKELDKKKGGLLDRKGYDYLVEFHDLDTIRAHKNLYWKSFRQEGEEVSLEKGRWITHFVPFSRSAYPNDYDVKSWFIFLCLGPEVVAKREEIELEVAPPVLVFGSESGE